jgi:hypothetical protein
MSEDLDCNEDIAVRPAGLNAVGKIAPLDDANGIRYRTTETHQDPRLRSKADFPRAR